MYSRRHEKKREIIGRTVRISSFRVVQDVRLHPENLKGAVAMMYRAGYIFVVKTETLVSAGWMSYLIMGAS